MPKSMVLNIFRDDSRDLYNPLGINNSKLSVKVVPPIPERLLPIKPPRKQLKPGVKAPAKPRKKSTIVSRWKKQRKVEDKKQTNAADQYVDPNAENERKQKRRISKFHPRPGEDDPKKKHASSISSHQQRQEKSSQVQPRKFRPPPKKKVTSVLSDMPPLDGSPFRPALDNNGLGLIADGDEIFDFFTSISSRLNFAISKIRSLAKHQSESEAKFLDQLSHCVTPLVNIKEAVLNQGSLTRQQFLYAISKTAIETRHARIEPNCCIQNLRYDPVTSKWAGELSSQLTRTPLIRNGQQQEIEADTLMKRHQTALVSEFKYSLDKATPVELMAASQNAMLMLYKDTINKDAELTQAEKKSHMKRVKSMKTLMAYMLRKHEKQLATPPQ